MKVRVHDYYIGLREMLEVEDRGAYAIRINRNEAEKKGRVKKMNVSMIINEEEEEEEKTCMEKKKSK